MSNLLRTALLPALLSPVIALAVAGPALASSTAAGTVSTSTVSVGTPILFSGGGFAPGATVTCFRNGKQVATPKADATGRFMWNMKNKTAGAVIYRAVGFDRTSGTRTLTASVTVTTSAVSTAHNVNSGSGGLAGTTDGDLPLAAATGLAGLLLAGATARRLSRR